MLPKKTKKGHGHTQKEDRKRRKKWVEGKEKLGDSLRYGSFAYIVASCLQVDMGESCRRMHVMVASVMARNGTASRLN